MTRDRFCTPPIPMGWFMVAYDDELPPAGVLPLRYFGRDLVLFRTESGEVALLDAFCPHLGAHLGHGGKVRGETLECPFHAWQFGTSGACVHVPYAKHLPRKAELTRWHVKVVGGLVMTWFHPEGGPPRWDIPDEVPEYGHADWTPYERRRWTIRTRNQEMAENSVDSAHFHYVHGTPNIPRSEPEVNGPVMRVFSNTGMDTPRGRVEGSVESLAFGFGFATVRFRGLVETLLVSATTPIDGERVDVRFNFSVKKLGGSSITRGVGKAFVDEIARQLEEDIPIWEHKVQHAHPMLCDGDGPIGLFRSWSKQFYVETQGGQP